MASSLPSDSLPSDGKTAVPVRANREARARFALENGEIGGYFYTVFFFFFFLKEITTPSFSLSFVYTHTHTHASVRRDANTTRRRSIGSIKV